MSDIRKIVVPDIGSTADVDVIELLVAPGDKVAKDDSLLTLEGEKATMEVPSPFAGIIKTLHVAIGDKVGEGDLIISLQSGDSDETQAVEKKTDTTKVPVVEPEQATSKEPKLQRGTQLAKPNNREELSAEAVVEEALQDIDTSADYVHAGPAVRRFARELGVNLEKVAGSGRKGRMLRSDIEQYVKRRLATEAEGASGAWSVPEMLEVDFSQFGAIDKQPLGKIKKLTATHMHRSWVTIPHVTQFDEADITELESFRKDNKATSEAKGFKLTPLAFIMKAIVATLKEFPQFNASLDPQGEQLILKKYYHIGVAVETPNGLVVPVIRDADRKGIYEIAESLATMSGKAREKRLLPQDMQGGSFTISSLGGIGGTAFTPIVNAPEVAILGVAKSKIQPVYSHGEFVPRLMLPLALSYDHRVIDGAEAASFTRYLAECLADIRRVLM